MNEDRMNETAATIIAIKSFIIYCNYGIYWFQLFVLKRKIKFFLYN